MVCLLAGGVSARANDAEYYSSGNQLVPLESTNIRLEEELLSIKKVDSPSYPFDVEVRYTLYNEGPPRRILIGFEAPGPIGEERDENDFFYTRYNVTAKLKAEHEAIRKKKYHLQRGELVEDFQVFVNGRKRPYEAADMSRLKSRRGSTLFVGELYYFTAYLKHGRNTIRHRYRCQRASGTVYVRYDLDYILATARHWKGGRIGDFTLRLDMGGFEEFSIFPTFFDDLRNWRTPHGSAKIFDKNITYPDGTKYEERYAEFFLRDGQALFHKKDFLPRSGIFLESDWPHLYGYPNGWETSAPQAAIFTKERKLSFLLCGSHSEIERPVLAADLTSLRLLRALPYACRGAEFSDPAVAAYYRSLPWYRPDPDYDPASSDYPLGDFRRLSPGEKEWLDRLKLYRNH